MSIFILPKTVSTWHAEHCDPLRTELTFTASLCSSLSLHLHKGHRNANTLDFACEETTYLRLTGLMRQNDLLMVLNVTSLPSAMNIQFDSNYLTVARLFQREGVH